MSIPLKAHRFMLANEKSPVVYLSCDGSGCVYRLLDGQTFRLGREECQTVGVPLFAHLAKSQATDLHQSETERLVVPKSVRA